MKHALDTRNREYEYDEIGLPFLRDLGVAIHEVELKRERALSPDFSRFTASKQRANCQQKTKCRERDACYGADDAE